MNTAETTRFFLKKDDRLKSRKAIGMLFSQGKVIVDFPLRASWMLNENDQGLKAGFAAGTKNFKRATDRNRVKRLLREAYRLQKNMLENDDLLREKSLHIFFIYTGKELPAYELIFSKTGNILKKLRRLLHEQSK